ncbi:MAG: ATP phosphoribosyltransferase [Clostridiales bacterium]|jgi:ATP phosphoribosyltransferase|nr:ATP phosphoribosyltransferase [Clostridiales bacterium]
MRKITIALPKGRLAEMTVDVLEKLGIKCEPLKTPTRKLVLSDGDGKYRFIYVKPSDVPTYVERGTADMGIAGKDTLMEERRDVYEMADLKFGVCRMCLAGFPGRQGALTRGTVTAASKYVNVAKTYFASKNIDADVIKLNGSVELAPVVGLADVIVDIVESGKTLEANGLVILDEIAAVSARLIVNKSNLKTKSAEILPLIEGIKRVINEETAENNGKTAKIDQKPTKSDKGAIQNDTDN